MMTVTRENFDFMTQSFDKFIGAYIDTIEKRQNDAFTEEDVANQDRMRRRWLEDQLYADPFASRVVPYEVWSLANLPPVIKW